MQRMTVDEVLNAFDQIDRPGVGLPQSFAAINWDELDYLSWRDPSNMHRFYMCIPTPARMVGLVFRVAPLVPGHVGGVCDLCLAADRINGATLATTESWTNPRARHGIHVCADFDCNGSVRGTKWVDRMGETLSPGRRIERMQKNLANFVQSVTQPAP